MVRNLDRFVAEASDGLHNYLRLAIRNAIRDEVRRAHRRPALTDLDQNVMSDNRSPVDEAVGRERLARYEAALELLTPSEREAVVARVEFGFTHVELAAAIGKPTPDAARKFCQKATKRLLALMRENSSPPQHD